MIDVQTFTGADVAPHLEAVAALRIAVFRDWPYLYVGDREYEKKYLATYAESPESLFVLALDGERVIGASTGIPLTDEVENFQKPFVEKGIKLRDVFYFGESVLLVPEFCQRPERTPGFLAGRAEIDLGDVQCFPQRRFRAAKVAGALLRPAQFQQRRNARLVVRVRLQC